MRRTLTATIFVAATIGLTASSCGLAESSTPSAGANPTTATVTSSGADELSSTISEAEPSTDEGERPPPTDGGETTTTTEGTTTEPTESTTTTEPPTPCDTRVATINALPITAHASEVVTGDREFGGNTVQISAQVETRWEDDRIALRLTFLAREMGGDGSSGRGDSNWIANLVEVGPDERIIGATAGGQALPDGSVAANLNVTDDEHGATTYGDEGLVSSWRVVADTDDDDIGNNNGDEDANVIASFRLIDVQIERVSGGCVPA